MGTIFRTIFYQPAFNALIFLYRLFGGNLGIAIILLAILSRLLTYPMTKVQLKSAEKSKDFQKEYDKLKKKYGKNKDKLNEELAKLQAQYLPGQIAGCLPMILLIIFLIQVRNVIRALVESGVVAFNEVAYPFIEKFAEGAEINFSFLGMDLSKVATNFEWSSSEIIPYVLLAVTVGASQFLSARILSGIRTFKQSKKPKKKAKKKKKEKDDEELDMSEMMSMMSKQMMFMFPALTILTSLGYWGGARFFPSGISIFWTVQNLFVIIQRLLMNKEESIDWFKVKILKQEIDADKKKSKKSENKKKKTKSSKKAKKKNKSKNKK